MCEGVKGVSKALTRKENKNIKRTKKMTRSYKKTTEIFDSQKDNKNI